MSDDGDDGDDLYDEGGLGEGDEFSEPNQNYDDEDPAGPEHEPDDYCGDGGGDDYGDYGGDDYGDYGGGSGGGGGGDGGGGGGAPRVSRVSGDLLPSYCLSLGSQARHNHDLAYSSLNLARFTRGLSDKVSISVPRDVRLFGLSRGYEIGVPEGGVNEFIPSRQRLPPPFVVLDPNSGVIIWDDYRCDIPPYVEWDRAPWTSLALPHDPILLEHWRLPSGSVLGVEHLEAASISGLSTSDLDVLGRKLHGLGRQRGRRHRQGWVDEDAGSTAARSSPFYHRQLQLDFIAAQNRRRDCVPHGRALTSTLPESDLGFPVMHTWGSRYSASSFWRDAIWNFASLLDDFERDLRDEPRSFTHCFLQETRQAGRITRAADMARKFDPLALALNWIPPPPVLAEPAEPCSWPPADVAASRAWLVELVRTNPFDVRHSRYRDARPPYMAAVHGPPPLVASVELARAEALARVEAFLTLPDAFHLRLVVAVATARLARVPVDGVVPRRRPTTPFNWRAISHAREAAHLARLAAPYAPHRERAVDFMLIRPDPATCFPPAAIPTRASRPAADTPEAACAVPTPWATVPPPGWLFGPPSAPAPAAAAAIDLPNTELAQDPDEFDALLEDFGLSGARLSLLLDAGGFTPQGLVKLGVAGVMRCGVAQNAATRPQSPRLPPSSRCPRLWCRLSPNLLQQ